MVPTERTETFKISLGIFLLLLLLVACGQPVGSSKTFRVASMADADSLDPRLARGLQAMTVINLLFEGLMRVDAQGTLQPSAASSYQVSPDGLTYTFAIRDNLWSNGDPVTAEDFVYAWQSQLNRTVPAPNGHHLAIVQSIEAKDPQTLVVTLKRPNVYFLEMLAYIPFFPVNSRVVAEHSDWAEGNLSFFSSNGPFGLVDWKPQYELTVVKRPSYWNQKSVNLDRVQILTLDEHTAFSLFQTGNLDWVGSPLSNLPPDAIASLKSHSRLTGQAQAAGVHWIRVNTTDASLSDSRMRRALALAIDRKGLVDHILQDGQQPAMAIIPPGFGWTARAYFSDHQVEEAKALLAEALAGKPLPILTFTYGYSERHHKIAQVLQEQWRKGLGMEIALEALESKTFYERLRTGQYQLANGSWFADFRDPVNFLSVFKSRDNGTNNTGWESTAYRQFVDQASQEQNPEFLLSAERLLMDEMPVIPIFFYTFSYLKNSKVTGVGLSELGILNLDKAEFSRENGNSN